MCAKRQCTLVFVAVGCVLLMALCIWLMVYADGSDKGAWLLGLLLPCILVLCSAFAVLSYTMVHLICPTEEEEEEAYDGSEMTTTTMNNDDGHESLILVSSEAQNI